jgi:hypothetical protein
MIAASGQTALASGPDQLVNSLGELFCGRADLLLCPPPTSSMDARRQAPAETAPRGYTALASLLPRPPACRTVIGTHGFQEPTGTQRWTLTPGRQSSV